MATSGTFTGARGGNSTGPYLTLAWTRAEVDAANNRSRLTLTLRLHSDYSISFSSSKTGVLQGTSFTYTAGFSGTGSRIIKTQDVWVTHNSDGSKTQALSATFNIGINWGGSNVASLSVSGNAVLDAIPRASTFTISGGTIGSPITVNISRADSSFYHSVIYQVPNGTQRGRWNSVATQHTWTPPLSDSGYIPNATSTTATIVVHTYNSAGTHVGTTSKNFTLSVPASIVPTISSFNVSLAGSGRDWDLGMYIQNISKAVSSFQSAGVYGSTIVSNKITVRRVSDGGNSQTISGTSGTTPTVLTLSGQYEAIAETTDSRGRTATSRLTFNVNPYQAPAINLFTTYRTTPTSSVINNFRVSWSNITTSNPATITITGKAGTSAATTLYTLTNSTAGSVDTSRTYTGQSDSQSHTYTITVTDSFGKTASATAKVGTTFVEFTIARGQGVGIGKVWEKGALDVGGEAWFSSSTGHYIHLKPVNSSYSEIRSNSAVVDLMQKTRQYTGDFEIASANNLIMGSGNIQMGTGNITTGGGLSLGIDGNPTMTFPHLRSAVPLKFIIKRVSVQVTNSTAGSVTVSFTDGSYGTNVGTNPFPSTLLCVWGQMASTNSTAYKPSFTGHSRTGCTLTVSHIHNTSGTYTAYVDVMAIGY